MQSQKQQTDAEFMLAYATKTKSDCLCTRRQTAVLDALEALSKIAVSTREEPNERYTDPDGNCTLTNCDCSNHMAREALRKFREAMEGKNVG